MEDQEAIYPIGYMPPPTRKLTVLAFRNRFTPAEKAAIELAAVHNPDTTIEVQMRAAMRRAFLADVSSARHIEPERSEVRDNLEVLEHWGDIAVGRAAEILDAPIQAHELP